MRLRLIVLLVVVVIGIIIIANTVLVVDAGHVAVIFNTITGNLSTRYPGTNILLPTIQRAIPYDTRIQTYTMSASYAEGEVKGDDALEALTKDGQVVKLDISVRFHVDPAQVTQ